MLIDYYFNPLHHNFKHLILIQISNKWSMETRIQIDDEINKDTYKFKRGLEIHVKKWP